DGPHTRVMPSPAEGQRSAPASDRPREKTSKSAAVPQRTPSIPAGTEPSAASLEARKRLRLRIAIGVMALVIAMLALTPKRDARVQVSQPAAPNAATAPQGTHASGDALDGEALPGASEALEGRPRDPNARTQTDTSHAA